MEEIEVKTPASVEKPNEIPAEATDDDAPVTINLENYRPDDVPTFYSDGMVVVHTANEFVLSFLQTEFPIARSTQELKQVESMKRKCIAQIIVSPPQAERVITALQENMNKYVNVYRKPESDR